MIAERSRAGERHRGATWRAAIVAVALLATAAVATAAPPAAAAAPAVSVVGCDLLGPDISAAVCGYAQRNDLGLALALDGSRHGAAEVAAGRADVAFLVLRPEDAPPADAYRSLPFGYFTTIVLVPQSLPVAQLSLRQLAGIFGAGSTSGFARWGELGVSGDAATRGVEPEAMAAGTGLALELFRHLVLKDGDFKSTVIRQPTAAALRARLAVAAGGVIALANSVPADAADLRIVPVARRDQDVGFSPTPENIHAGDYPLRLTIWLVVRRDFVGKGGLDFMRFLLSDEVAATAARAGVVPLPTAARRQAAFDLEQP